MIEIRNLPRRHRDTEKTREKSKPECRNQHQIFLRKNLFLAESRLNSCSYAVLGVSVPPWWTFLDPKLHHRRPRSAFVLRRLDQLFHVRMLLQKLANGLSQDSHTAAMNDPNTRHSCQESTVNKFLYLARGTIHGMANHVDLCGQIQVVLKRN